MRGLNPLLFVLGFVAAALIVVLPVAAPHLVLPALIALAVFGLGAYLGAPALQNVFSSVLALALAVFVLGPLAGAEGMTNTVQNTPIFDLPAFGKNLLDAVIFAVSSSITVGFVTTVTDFVVSKIPILRPWRDLVIQFILGKRDEIRQSRAEKIVLEAGHAYRSGVIEKPERAEIATDSVIGAGIVSDPGQARRLVESAVAVLKAKGVNP